MAAPARPPAISDARIPCPLCGGLIHPVAGRCKHCKQDLAPLRAGRPQAATPLPALDRTATPASPVRAPLAVAPVAIAVDEPSLPILPPRPTGRSAAAREPGTLWKSWPVIVILLASIAIVTALAVMVWPAGRGAGKHALQPPPAPERMDTNPMPPSPPPPSTPPGADPWGGHSQVTPPAPRHTPDPLPAKPDPDDDILNPFGSLGGGTGGTGGAGRLSGDFIASFSRHLCDRLAVCGNGSTVVQGYCEVVRNVLPPPSLQGPSCDAGKRCLETVDKLDCTTQTDDADAMNLIITRLPDCLEAATRC